MKQYQVTLFDLETAKQWTSFNGNQFTRCKDPQAQTTGRLGEIYYQRNNKEAIKINDHGNIQSDFIIDGKRVDVKTTFCKYDPQPYYGLLVQANQINFNSDEYYFYWWNTEKNTIIDLGYISKQDFDMKAKLFKTGDVFPGSKVELTGDVYRIEIKELKQYD